MVKSIIYTVLAVILSLIFFIMTDVFIERQFAEFGSALQTLYYKVEAEEAVREDAVAVRTLWNDRKRKLHVFVPHNDLSSLDYYLGEACGLIYEKQYEPALGKLEALIEMARNLPSAYTVSLENVF